MRTYILKRPEFNSAPRALRPQSYDKAVDELLGLARGILADGKVTADEVEYLRSWLERRKEFVSAWPLNIVAKRIASICADGIITDEECKSLGETLVALTGEAETLEGLPSVADKLEPERPIQSCFTVPVPEILFTGNLFCLSGNFVYGPKNRVAESIVERGGNATDRLTQDVNFLLVGSIVNKAWAHGSYGRKIEKAMTDWRHIAIISEEHWTAALEIAH